MQLWGLTDPGNLREQNQDSYAMLSFSRDRSLMIVCDGMGGAKSGNVASSLAVDVFTDEVRRCQKSGLTPERAAEILRGALELANKAVYEQAQLSDDANRQCVLPTAGQGRQHGTGGQGNTAPAQVGGKQNHQRQRQQEIRKQIAFFAGHKRFLTQRE